MRKHYWLKKVRKNTEVKYMYPIMMHRGYIARKHHKQLRHDNSFFKFF